MNWKAIPGYDGAYVISDTGVVRSKNGDLKTDLNTIGRHRVTLCKGGKTKRLFVHRLVAQVFIPNPEGKKNVGVKSKEFSSTSANNLYWK